MEGLEGFTKSLRLCFCAIQVGTGIIGRCDRYDSVMIKWCLKDIQEGKNSNYLRFEECLKHLLSEVL